MSRSFCQSSECRCTQCPETFSIDVWFIVDSGERPDLWARCIDGSIHRFVCPNGHIVFGYPTILLHDSAQKHLYFCVSEERPVEDNQKALNRLINQFISTIRPEDREPYLTQVALIPRKLFRTVLSGNPPEIVSRLEALFDNIFHSKRLTDLQIRIAECNEALQLIDKDNDPILWASFQNALGNTLSHFQGSPTEYAEYLDRSIEAHRSAIEVLEKAGVPEFLAQAKNDLGTAYAERVRGSIANNLENAISCFEEARSVLNQTAFPNLWAATQENLGSIYAQRIRGHRTENLETAIQAFELALTIYTLETHPRDWARVISNLANAYSQRIKGSRGDNLETAIQLYKSALSVYTLDEFPNDWALVQNNLSTAYLERLNGERTQNLEQAIEHAELALKVFTNETPQDWSMALVNLGVAYTHRMRGDRQKNFGIANEAFERARTVYTKESNPYKYAAVQNGIGILNTRLDTADSRERSIDAFKDALTVYTKEAFPDNWAKTQSNLAAALAHRIHGDSEENQEEAIERFGYALEFYNPYTSRVDWAETQANLGNAYYSRIRGDAGINLAKAAECLKAALEVFEAERLAFKIRLTARNLGRVYIKQKDFLAAYECFKIAIKAAESLYSSSITEVGRITEIKENARLYQSMVEICLRPELSRPVEAFLFAEEGRSRILRDQLSIPDEALPTTIPEELITTEKRLLLALRELEISLRNESENPARTEWVNKAEEIRAQVSTLWDDMLRDYGAYDYVALRRGEKLKWEELQTWMKSQGTRIAFLEFFPFSTDLVIDQIVTFIIRDGEVVPRVVFLSITPERLSELTTEFFTEFHYSDDADTKPLTELGNSILPHLIPHLNDIDLLCIIPYGLFHYWPLHALEYLGKPLIEYFPVVYSPSVGITVRSGNSSRFELDMTGQSSLVIGNPTGDLPDAEYEAIEVGRIVGATPLLGDEAIKTRTVEGLKDKNHAHLATHAFFDKDDAFSSGIHLANKEILSAKEVATYRLKIDLLVLSACETGLQSILPGDELVGFSRAFLYAGVRSLILSLWQVDDQATSELMKVFYETLSSSNNYEIAKALQIAVIETKKAFPHPYYWAPFALFGSWK